MKNLRNKLFAAVAMLLVSGVMLTSASFAWFTISTSPEVSNIKTEIQSNYNLEIMLDNNYTSTSGTSLYAGDNAQTLGTDSVTSTSGRNVKWGNLVDLKDTSFSSMLPALSSGSGISKIKFGLDGRISGSEAASYDGTGVITYKDGNEVVGYKIDLWLRSNKDNIVSLSTSGISRAYNNTSITNNDLGLGSKFVTSDSEAIVPTIEIYDYDTNTVYTTSTSGIAGTYNSTYSISSASGISLTANQPKKIGVLVYYSASGLTNEKLANSSSGTINLQFTGNVTEDAYNYSASGYGRQ